MRRDHQQWQEIARRLRREMGKRGYSTIREFAQKSGLAGKMSYEVIRQVLNTGKPCRETTLLAISDALGIGRRDTAELLDLAGSPALAGLTRKRPDERFGTSDPGEREIVDLFRDMSPEAQSHLLALLRVVAK